MRERESRERARERESGHCKIKVVFIHVKSLFLTGKSMRQRIDRER